MEEQLPCHEEERHIMQEPPKPQRPACRVKPAVAVAMQARQRDPEKRDREHGSIGVRLTWLMPAAFSCFSSVTKWHLPSNAWHSILSRLTLRNIQVQVYLLFVISHHLPHGTCQLPQDVHMLECGCLSPLLTTHRSRSAELTSDTPRCSSIE